MIEVVDTTEQEDVKEGHYVPDGSQRVKLFKGSDCYEKACKFLSWAKPQAFQARCGVMDNTTVLELTYVR